MSLRRRRLTETFRPATPQVISAASLPAWRLARSSAVAAATTIRPTSDIRLTAIPSIILAPPPTGRHRITRATGLTVTRKRLTDPTDRRLAPRNTIRTQEHTRAAHRLPPRTGNKA